MRLRFTIRDLLWLTVVVALAIAWYADYRRAFVRVHALTAAGHSPNLHLWVPDEELDVWDPVNVNVMPVPWRVRGPKGDDGQRSAEFRHMAINKRVQVEGIGWGNDGKNDLPSSSVFLAGGVILVDGIDLSSPGVRGKPVRVVGTLRLNYMPSLGFALKLSRYYCLEAESFEVIEKVVEPEVILSPRHDVH